MPQAFLKDAQAVLDYTIDWSDWLVSDAISTSAWEAATGITIDSDTNTGTTATVWLSGGTAGQKYAVTNTIVTAAARTEQRTITVRAAVR